MKIIFSSHAQERIIERNIKKSDVIEAIKNPDGGLKMIINIDTQAKAAYIKLKEGTCHHTKEILPEVFADFNSHNEIIGVELVSPCTITLRKLARKLKLPIFNKIKKPLEEICS